MTRVHAPLPHWGLEHTRSGVVRHALWYDSAMSSSPTLRFARVLGGRYLLYTELASGGMATVHLGLLLGPEGFSRTVAIKRLHAQFAKDPEFVAMFVDEAKLAARIRHPNVVPTVDVVTVDGEPFLIMEYVHGESLASLIRAARDRGERIPPEVAAAIVAGALQGLQAAHDARDEKGERLDLIHRDVSPQNVLVGIDGVARVLDFGIAKASGRAGNTREGEVKGKLGYMAPEQFQAGVSIASDIYGAGVCLWEALTGQRLFHGDNESSVLAKVLAGIVERPSKRIPDLPPALDEITLRALARDPTIRFLSAREMAGALEADVRLASSVQVGEWVADLASDALQSRARRVSKMEEEFSHCLELGLAPGAAEAVVAVAPPVEKPAPRRIHPAVWVAVGAVAAIVLVLIGAVLGAGRGARAQQDARSPSSSAPLASEPEGAPAAAPVEAAEQAQIELVESAPPPRARAPRRSAPKPALKRAPPAASTSADCAEPYTLDADGLKHYKKECLR